MSTILLEESKFKIDNIDFTTTRQRLCLSHHQGGFEWALIDAEFAIKRYVAFLESVLNYVHQKVGRPIFFKEARRLFEQAVAEEDRGVVAIVWEAHVLSTRQYAEDCHRIFKCFLHYSPGLIVSDVPL